MPAANETPAPSAPAAKPSYFETMLEKAKKLPPGKAKEADREEREMRERAAADPEVATYLDYLCRKFLGTRAGSVRLTASLKDWERQQQQQQQQEEEERKKKEEEEEKARSERKRKAEEDTSQLDQSATSRKVPRVVPTAAPTAPTLPGPVTAYLNPNPDPGCHVSCASSDYHPRKPCPAAVAEEKLAANAAREEKRAAKKAGRLPGPYIPRAEDWLCRCSFWNGKYTDVCRGNVGGVGGVPCDGVRKDSVRVQEPGPGIEEPWPCRAKYDGDWCCACGRWNRPYMKFCGKCPGHIDETWVYTAVDGVDGELPDAPEKEGYEPTEAQKKGRFLATHQGYWRPKSRRYKSR